MPEQDTQTLVLPKALASAARRLHGIFFQFLSDVNIVMGGGSVLAARWNHRVSTDIDLFVSRASMVLLTTDKNLPYQGVLNQLQGIGEANLEPLSGFLSGDIEGTPFSLAASEFVRDDRRVLEVIDGTFFQAATNEEILSGKLKGRLHRSGAQPSIAPIRDLYDIVVAAHMDPGIVDRVLEGITSKGRSVVAADLRRLPDTLHQNDLKPILNPRFEVDMYGLPKAVAAAVEAGDETLLPPASNVMEVVTTAPQP